MANKNIFGGEQKICSKYFFVGKICLLGTHLWSNDKYLPILTVSYFKATPLTEWEEEP